MSRRLFIKARSLDDSEVNAIEIYLYHSKERKSVQVVIQGVEHRKENGMVITTSMLYGGVRAKVMDMPRFSKAKFDAIPLDNYEMKELIHEACMQGKLQLVLNEQGEMVTL